MPNTRGLQGELGWADASTSFVRWKLVNCLFMLFGGVKVDLPVTKAMVGTRRAGDSSK